MQRHPLHTITQVIQYSDGFNRQNIAVKIGQVGKSVYQCYVFQCHNEVNIITNTNTLMSVSLSIVNNLCSIQNNVCTITMIHKCVHRHHED